MRGNYPLIVAVRHSKLNSLLPDPLLELVLARMGALGIANWISFTSWLRPRPDAEISGGQVVFSGTTKTGAGGQMRHPRPSTRDRYKAADTSLPNRTEHLNRSSPWWGPPSNPGPSESAQAMTKSALHSGLGSKHPGETEAQVAEQFLLIRARLDDAAQTDFTAAGSEQNTISAVQRE